MTNRRHLRVGFAILGAATVLCLAVAVREARNNPYGALEGRTDHFSHRNSVALMLRLLEERGVRGMVEIYRVPIRDVASTAFGESFVLPERPDQPPLGINWSFMPRPYPPGSMLYHLPDAIVTEWFGASFAVGNGFTIFKYVLATAALLAMIWRMLLLLHEKTGNTALFALDVTVYAVLGLELFYWSLAGFYDVFPLGLLFAAVFLLRLERPGLAMLLLMAAVACHYRAVWYAPLGVYALIRFIQAQRRREGGLRALLSELRLAKRKPSFYFRATGVLTIVVFFLLALWTFRLISPFLAGLPLTNPFRPGIPDVAVSIRLFFVFVTVLAGMGLWQRHFAFSATLLFTAVMLYVTPLMQYWHSIWVFPMFAVAGLSDRGGPLLRPAVFVWIAYITQAYFETNVFKLTTVREWIRLFTA